MLRRLILAVADLEGVLGPNYFNNILNSLLMDLNAPARNPGSAPDLGNWLWSLVFLNDQIYCSFKSFSV